MQHPLIAVPYMSCLNSGTRRLLHRRSFPPMEEIQLELICGDSRQDTFSQQNAGQISSTYRYETMVLQNDGLTISQGLGDILPLLSI